MLDSIDDKEEEETLFEQKEKQLRILSLSPCFIYALYIKRMYPDFGRYIYICNSYKNVVGTSTSVKPIKLSNLRKS